MTAATHRTRGRARARTGVSFVVLLAAIAGAACAAPERGGPMSPRQPSAASDDERRAIEDARQAIAAREVELDTAAAQAAPDCARACLLESEICALADRICAIAARYPAGDPVRELCTDGHARCARAHEAVKARCTCALPR